MLMALTKDAELKNAGSSVNVRRKKETDRLE